MASDDASLVFMRDFLLAQRSKAPEIRIKHHLAALDEDMLSVVESSIRPEPPFLLVPHQDLPLSAGAAAALEPLGDIFDISLKALRNLLLDAQRRVRRNILLLGMAHENSSILSEVTRREELGV